MANESRDPGRPARYVWVEPPPPGETGPVGVEEEGGGRREVAAADLAGEVCAAGDVVVVAADARDLVLHLARLAGPAAPAAVAALTGLAAAGRLVCLGAADHLRGLAGRGGPGGVAPGAAAGRAARESLDPAGTGPLGPEVRGRVAAGAASAAGLRVSPEALPEVLGRLEQVREAAFRDLVGHAGAADCFKGGKRAAADGKGFRATNAKLAAWVADRVDGLEDARGQPAAFAGVGGVQARNWPPHALGSAPLADLSEFQAA